MNLEPPHGHEHRDWLGVAAVALVSLACAALLLVVFYLVGRPLGTDDLWFHLKMGETYARDLWPASDPMLFTSGPIRPVQHSWLFGVIVYEAARVVGLRGLRVLHVLTVAGILGLAYAILRRERAAPAFTMSALITFVVLNWFRLFQLRPDLVSILCALALYRLLLEHEEPPTKRRIGAAVLTLLFWANAHSVFMVGFALLAAALCGLGLRAHLQARLGEDASREWRTVRALGLVSLLALAATLLNPRGFEQHLTFFHSSATTTVLAVADEWSPFHPFAPPNPPNPALTTLAWCLGDALLLLLAAALALGALRWLRGPSRSVLDTFDPKRAALAAASAVAMIAALRFLWLGFFVLLYLLHVAHGVLAAQPRARKRLELGLAAGALGVALLFPGQISFASFVAETQQERRGYFESVYLRQRYAAAGMEFLRDAGLEGHLFNPYHLGGFLGYWLSPRLRTFIDGRAEHYPPEVLAEYQAIRLGKTEPGGPSPLERLDRRSANVFFAAGRPFALSYGNTYTFPLVEGDPHWIPVFRARDHGVFLRRDASNDENLRRVESYYAREGVTFDPVEGFDVALVLRTRPDWLAAREVLPVDYPQLLLNRESPDPELRFAALSRLAELYADLGDWRSQIAADQAALELRPDALLERERLVMTLAEHEGAGPALAQARELVRRHPTDERALTLRRRLEAIVQERRGQLPAP